MCEAYDSADENHQLSNIEIVPQSVAQKTYKLGDNQVDPDYNKAVNFLHD